MSSSIPAQPIDRQSFVPFYIQVIDLLTEYIDNNQLPPGHQLPGEAELCQTFDVSRTVIRQALQELVYKGLIYQRERPGYFCRQTQDPRGPFPGTDRLLSGYGRQGAPPGIGCAETRSGPGHQKKWQNTWIWNPGTELIQIDRLRYINQEPIVLVTTYLPYEICPELLQVDLTNQSLYAYLENEHGLQIASGKRFLEAVVANQMEAELLQVDLGAP